MKQEAFSWGKVLDKNRKKHLNAEGAKEYAKNAEKTYPLYALQRGGRG
jgi:hypothetical protein